MAARRFETSPQILVLIPPPLAQNPHPCCWWKVYVVYEGLSGLTGKSGKLDEHEYAAPHYSLLTLLLLPAPSTAKGFW